MKVRNLFSKKKVSKADDIFRYSSVLEEKIKYWIEREGWKFEDFAKIVEQTGLKVTEPISYTNKVQIYPNLITFKCNTTNGQEVTISLQESYMSQPAMIFVTQGKITYKYLLLDKMISKTEPKVILCGKTIENSNRHLDIEFFEGHYKATIKVKNTPNALFLLISRLPQKSQTVENYQKLEEYLMKHVMLFRVKEIYDIILMIFGLTAEELDENYVEVIINYTQDAEPQERILSRLRSYQSTLVEYAIHEGETVYWVYANGDWKYWNYTEGSRIMYNAKKQQHTFTVTGKRESIKAASIMKALEKAEEKISGMWKFVGR